MKGVMFVCHGNICRSPMAEFIFRDLVRQQRRSSDFVIASSGTSREELGNPVYPPAVKQMAAHGLSCSGKRAVQLTREQYNRYDYFLAMDSRNVENMHRLFGGDPQKKIYRLLDFTDHPGDIADPWYTENFEQAYTDILRGCMGFLAEIQR